MNAALYMILTTHHGLFGYWRADVALTNILENDEDVRIYKNIGAMLTLEYQEIDLGQLRNDAQVER
jgi:hypothetical protein